MTDNNTTYTIVASYKSGHRSGGINWTGGEWMHDSWEPDVYDTMEEAQTQARYLEALPEGWEVFIVENSYDKEADEFYDKSYKIAS